jgi:Fe-S cluster assembly protein SufB
MALTDLDLGRYQLGWSDTETDYVFKPKKGLNEEIVREMSAIKKEPDWMRDFRLKALARFERKPMAGVVRGQHAEPRLRRHLSTT